MRKKAESKMMANDASIFRFKCISLIGLGQEELDVQINKYYNTKQKPNISS